MHQISNFRRPRGHPFFPKNGSYRYGAKSRWGPPSVNLGANGVPLGRKKGAKSQKLPCTKIRIFDYPAVIGFSEKIENYGYGAKSRWGPPRVHLGANGVPLGRKNGSKRKNDHAPKFEFSTTLRSSIFPQKWKLPLWRQIAVGTP